MPKLKQSHINIKTNTLSKTGQQQKYNWSTQYERSATSNHHQ